MEDERRRKLKREMVEDFLDFTDLILVALQKRNISACPNDIGDVASRLTVAITRWDMFEANNLDKSNKIK